MKTIYKYKLDIRDRQLIEMPDGAEFLRVEMQGNDLCLWALVDPKEDLYHHEIGICGTGHPCPYEVSNYIGTVFDNEFVWHVFDMDIVHRAVPRHRSVQQGVIRVTVSRVITYSDEAGKDLQLNDHEMHLKNQGWVIEESDSIGDE